MSGALKLVGKSAGFGDDLSGDLRVTINDIDYRIESKRKQNADTVYKLAEEGLVHIKGFCYLLREEVMRGLLNGVDLAVDKEVEDKGFGYLHKFFDQDDSDIVTIWRPWHNYLFFLTESTYQKIIGE